MKVRIALGGALFLQAVFLLLLAHESLARAPDFAPVLHERSQWPLTLQLLAALVVAVAAAAGLRRGQAPRWAPLGAALGLVVVGAIALPPEPGNLTRHLLLRWTKPEATQGVALVGLFDGLGAPMLALFLGSMLALAWLPALAARARQGATTTRRGPRFWAALLLALAGLAMIIRSSGVDVSPRTLAPPLPVYLTLVSLGALLAGAPALADDDDGRRRQTLLELFVLAQTALALASLGVMIDALLVSLGFNWGGWVLLRDAADTPIFLPRHAMIGPYLALLLALVAAVLIPPKRDDSSFFWLGGLATGGAAVLPGVALYALLSYQLPRLDEARPGRPGELVIDHRIPPGQLWVDLVPAVSGANAEAPADISLGGVSPRLGSPRDRTENSPAIFEKLPANTPLYVQARGPYEFARLGKISLPDGVGARILLPALQHYPWPRPSPGFEPEMTFHLQIDDSKTPGMFTLYGMKGRVIYLALNIPRERATVREKLEQEWRARGNHRDPADRKMDTLVIHHAPGASFEGIVELAREIDTIQRDYPRGRRGPVFSLYASTWPL